MSENMRVSVILEINGCLPYVVGTKGSVTPKIMINPFFRNTIMENMSCAKVFIK
jgi:hypothetical protein